MADAPSPPAPIRPPRRRFFWPGGLSARLLLLTDRRLLVLAATRAVLTETATLEADVALADQEDEGSWVARIRAGAKLQDLVDIAAMIAERQKKDGAAHG